MNYIVQLPRMLRRLSVECSNLKLKYVQLEPGMVAKLPPLPRQSKIHRLDIYYLMIYTVDVN
ncbi:hypothetical protein TUM12147_11410 [Citrobacter europaeus]|nr:hypothetical protein TUM12147_11410 [Citrobacter europaeus]GIZ25134.1 hypothetical protein TUM12148_37980 [Citrobacter europaeus]